MPYKTIEALRTARNEALAKTDFWFALDTPYWITGMHTTYREDLRNITLRIYVKDDAFVKDADGDLQQYEGVKLELPTEPILEARNNREKTFYDLFGILYEQRY